MDNNEIVTEEEREEVYVFLTQLRVSEDAPNMMEAPMHLRAEFGYDKPTSWALAKDWIKWFSKQPEEVIRKIEEKV